MSLYRLARLNLIILNYPNLYDYIHVDNIHISEVFLKSETSTLTT